MNLRKHDLSLAAAVLCGVLLLAQAASADDRKLLYSTAAAPPNIMIVVANTESMATCIGGQTLKNGATCPSTGFTYGSPLAPGGANDSPDSKLGIAKAAIANIINTNGSNFNWGLTTFSVDALNMSKSSTFAKRYTFEVQTDNSGASNWFYQTPGTLIDFQPSGSSMASPLTTTYGSSTNKRTYQIVPWGGSTTYSASLVGQESWVESSSDSLHQPYQLDPGGSTSSTRTLVTYPGDGDAGKISGSYQEFRITYVSTTASGSNPLQITHCSTLATCTQTITVTKTVYQCNPSKTCASGRSAATNYAFDPSLGNSDGVSSNDYSMTFVVPTSYCAETLTGSCKYPQLYADWSSYGVSSPYAGQEMGWIYYADSNMTVSTNQSGWINYKNAVQSPDGHKFSQLPLVLINHPYTPFYPQYTSSPFPLTYTQSSIPCILRSLRPTSSLVQNGAATSTAGSEHEYFPIVDGSAGGDPTTGCDKLVDGAYQSGLFYNSGSNPNFSSQVVPVVTPRSGGGAQVPLPKLLTNAWSYFAGSDSSNTAKPPSLIACGTTSGEPLSPAIDGFNDGRRPDDPQCSCRPTYMILITDSLVLPSGQQFSFSGSGTYTSASNDPTYGLNPTTGINVPVFVIGFAIPSGNDGANACTLKGSGTLPYGPVAGNVGECIADRTGAQTYKDKDGAAGNQIARKGYYTATDGASLGSALNSILSSLSNANRDFATATIPSVSSTSEGVAYLSEFIPRNNRSIWSGHLRALLLNSTGQVQPKGGISGNTPDLKGFTFWSGSSAGSGYLLWDAGTTEDTIGNDPNLVANGLLDSGCPTCTDTKYQPAVTAMVKPNTILAHSTQWSDTGSNSHDQGSLFTSPLPGRNVFFGVKPQDPGCTSSTYECLVQVPVGSGGNNTTEPFVVTTPDISPLWWATVRDSSTYVNIPSPLSIAQSTNNAGKTPSEASNNRDQALQNTFSFLRGNRDPVVEDLAISTMFTAANNTCDKLDGGIDASNNTTSPCYYGDILGDIFHSNPVVVSAPANFRYYLSQDSGAASAGTYADRGKSYQDFFVAHAHRRKILYAGANDALLHAFDIGVYNGDTSTYTSGSSTICPLCGHYDYGSGREIFGFAPLAGLNKAYSLAHTTSQDWSIDGAPSVDDVYIDVTRVGGIAQGVPAAGAGSDSPDVSGALPGSTSHSWRTVLVGTEREGGLTSSGSGITSGVSGNGGSVFALDVTDPDTDASMAQSSTAGTTGSPACLVNNFTPGGGFNSGCSSDYPRILWELRDDQSTTTTAPYPVELSTSSEGTTQDLGMTWSQPIVGRVKITDGGSPRDFFVAIFGGGFDHTGTAISNTNTSGNTGNFLYMVDIETGKIVYKKNLGICDPSISSGCASGTSTQGNLAAGLPGSPAVIDINGDGYLDAIYIGDTQGRLWKVDLTATATLSSLTNRVGDNDWTPTLFFDEYLNTAAQGTNVRRPIFNRPAVFFRGTSTTGSALLGIAFGTGDRDNMPILHDTNANYFIVLSDPPSKGSFPVTLSDLTLASLIADNCTSSNCLNANGYYVSLPTGSSSAHIVNTDALVFNQQIFFNTFLLSTTAGQCNDLGQAYFYRLNYLTGESTYTNADGTVAANQAAGTGVEVASTPIIYQDTNVYVVTATDNTSVQNIGGGNPPTAKVKSWKEQ